MSFHVRIFSALLIWASCGHSNMRWFQVSNVSSQAKQSGCGTRFFSHFSCFSRYAFMRKLYRIFLSKDFNLRFFHSLARNSNMMFGDMWSFIAEMLIFLKHFSGNITSPRVISPLSHCRLVLDCFDYPFFIDFHYQFYLVPPSMETTFSSSTQVLQKYKWTTLACHGQSWNSRYSHWWRFCFPPAQFGRIQRIKNTCQWNPETPTP